MIIFDELHYAEELLQNGFRKFMNYPDLFILAKYYRYQDLKPSTIYKNLEFFCLKYNSQYNKDIYGNRLDIAIKNSEKAKLRLPMKINITEKEIENIRSVKNFKYEKILFMMLVMSKMLKISENKNYFLRESFASILLMSKVYATKDERNIIKHDLYLLGMIDPISDGYKINSRGKDNFKLLYANEESSTLFSVDKIENVLIFYNPICENCGKEMKKRKKRDICDNCYEEKLKKDTLKRVKKFRNKTVTQ